MTLQKQLLITIAVLFICLFVGTLSISSYLTRTYLDKQLTTHARDAATSLGLLLSDHLNNNDISTATSVIDSDVWLSSVAAEATLDNEADAFWSNISTMAFIFSARSCLAN